MRRGGSWTATAVLAGVWLTACDPKTRRFVPDDLAEYTRHALLALGSRESRLVAQLQNRFIRVLVRLKESFLLPGICTHYAARKQPIFEQAKAHKAKTIILGAGLDGLSWRLSQFGHLAAEVDHPATQVRKKTILDALGSPIPLTPSNLSNPEEVDALFRSISDEPHFFVAEAVLMYLPEASVRQILSAIAEKNSGAVITFMSVDADNQPAFAQRRGLIRQLLKKTGEPFQWGISVDQAPAFFRECGFNTDAILGGRHPNAQRIEGMIDGEWIAVLSPISD